MSSVYSNSVSLFTVCRLFVQSPSGQTYFLYDGSVPVVEMNSSGVVTSTNSFDSEGNLAQRSDGSGTILSDHLFSAHGRILGGGLSEPFGYKAQYAYYTDTETGLQLLTHRYYDQDSGRFLTLDPIGYNGGINLFAYVHNNPMTHVDQLGLDDADKPWYVEDKGPLYPVGNPRPFEDGGILSTSTLSEFISANERAKRPCKPFGE